MASNGVNIFINPAASKSSEPWAIRRDKEIYSNATETRYET